MTWNYRLVRQPVPAHHTEPGEPDAALVPLVKLAEVYYRNDVPYAWCPATLESDMDSDPDNGPLDSALAELAADLGLMVAALGKPVLDVDRDGLFPEEDG